MRAVVRAGGGPTSITQNCSGKHAGMLATAVHNGWPTEGYRDPDHPVQRLILDDLRRPRRRGDRDRRRRVRRAGAGGVADRAGPGRAPAGRRGPPGAAGDVRAPRDGRRPAARRHPADAAGAGAAGQGRGRGRAGRRPARRPGGRRQDRRRRRAGPDAGHGRRAAGPRRRRRRRRVRRAGARPRRAGRARSCRWWVRREPGPAFQPLDGVVYGRVEQVAPMLRRVVAANPSKFTYRGTGTYIVGEGQVAVVDPGPDIGTHRDALHAALGRRDGDGDPRHPLPRRPLAARRLAAGRDRRADVRLRSPPAAVARGGRRARRGDRRGRQARGVDRPGVRARPARRRRRAWRRTGPGWTITRRAHARAHVEPHVLGVRRGGRAVPRRPRDGLEHDRGVAARRRHDRVHRLAAQGRRARRPRRTGRPTARRSRSRRATWTPSSTTAWSASARSSTPCAAGSARSRRSSPCSTPTSTRSCTSRPVAPCSPTSASSSTRPRVRRRRRWPAAAQGDLRAAS